MLAKPTTRTARRRGSPSGSGRPLSDPDLSVEIAILRKAIRKVSEMSEAESPDLATRLEALAAIGMAINRLASLLKTQRDLHGSDGESDSAILQALSEVAKELGFIQEEQ
jgi:hypothetical protein